MNFVGPHGVDLLLESIKQELDPEEFMAEFWQDSYMKKREKRTAQEFDDGEDEHSSTESERSYFAVPDSLKRKRRGAICCDVPNSPRNHNLPRALVPKSAATRASMETILSKNVMFSHLEGDQLSQIFSVMFEDKHKEGDIVFRQGDEGNKFYVLEKGECDIFTTKAGTCQHVATLTEGDAFGELALIYDSPRTSTVKAKTDITLWGIDRQLYRSIVMETTMKARKIYELFLESVPILAHLTKCERATVADCVTTEQYWEGDTIVKQDEPGDKFYIIVEGSVEISRNDESRRKLGTSQYFGEMALLTNQPCATTIVSVGQTKCVCLDRESFSRFLGPVEDILRQNMHNCISTVG